MGKIILEFDSIEESHDARVALDAMRWKNAVWDLDQELRKIVKYEESINNRGSLATVIEINTAQAVRDTLRGILHGYGLNIED